MSFDKNKAMRNAERFLSQGKIRAAIGEYQRVIENDPKDFSTLNILGDLYAKNLDKQQAVGCFTQVADYYNMQGFSHKAIAVYNKISRIEPSLVEVSAKLAELYQSKGSIAEARVHYTTLAEHYQRKGQKIEALAIWKQIAELDVNNTDIYLKIAETSWQEEQFEEAAQAFTEAGWRFIRQEKYESALTAFSRTLEIKKNDLRALKGSVKAQINLGCADEAAAMLEGIIKEQPYNRDILNLLTDCYLEMNSLPEAEKTIIKLVEQEPTSYPRFLDIAKLYLKENDLDGAARILSMSSEHLLVGGQAEDFLEWTNEILTRNPEHTEALRLLVRFHGWQRNEPALKQSLEVLAEAARLNDAVEDEHYALSQLVTLAPHEAAFSARLQEIKHAHGFETEMPTNGNGGANLPLETFATEPVIEETNGQNGRLAEFSFADVQTTYEFESNNLSADSSANGATATSGGATAANTAAKS
jgi:tetratricopeptide (TPR) repeat protein